MERSTMDLWVGIFVVAGMLGIVFLAMKVGNLTYSGGGNGYTLVANFENIGGLKVRSPVKSAGVVVGRIAEISYDNERFDAKVVMHIHEGFKFPKDTFAKIYTAGLLGEQYVGLAPGGDTAFLKDGDHIIKAEKAVVLEDLIGQFLYNKASEGAK